jgi:hypothetical protein
LAGKLEKQMPRIPLQHKFNTKPRSLTTSIEQEKSDQGFLVPQICVASPNVPPGMYDPEDLHCSIWHQVGAHLDGCAQPEWLKRYGFGPQHSTDFYQSVTLNRNGSPFH